MRMSDERLAFITRTKGLRQIDRELLQSLRAERDEVEALKAELDAVVNAVCGDCALSVSRVLRARDQ